jgi:tetratricopeptide (TPR) repeat protein
MLAEDLHHLPLTATPHEAATFNHALDGYVRYRADTPLRIQALIAAAPEMPMAHALKGAMVMLSFKLANVPAAREAATVAQQLAAGATQREQAHIAALTHWVAGDIEATLGVWEGILAEAPRDLLAFRLHHFLSFWMGEPERMAHVATNVSPAWSRDLPGYGTLLACRCFAHEELGRTVAAEADGRTALEIDPADLWAAHAVAHVLEMQGRQEEGIQLLDTLEPHWAGANNLLHHLWWHRGLYHYERSEFSDVLDLYDRRFRNLASPLVVQQPDLYIDVQNAVSLDGAGREGRSAGRRSSVGLYAAALDDGARRVPPNRGRRTHDRSHAAGGDQSDRHDPTPLAPSCPADLPGDHRQRQR